MRKEVIATLESIGGALASLERVNLEGLPVAAVVDIGARVNAMRQRAETLADNYKARLWAVTPAKADGAIVPGDTFNAVLTIVPASRLDVAALREAHPRIAHRFTIEADQHRVNYKARG